MYTVNFQLRRNVVGKTGHRLAPSGRLRRPEALQAARRPAGPPAADLDYLRVWVPSSLYIVYGATGHKEYSKIGHMDWAEIWICCRAGSITWG